MTNQEIAEVFSFIAEVLDLDPENRFRSRAYEEAGVVIAHLPYELQKRYASHADSERKFTEFQQELDALPGVGEKITAKLLELFQTGDIAAFQKYVAPFPAAIYPLVLLSGIGVKRALKLVEYFDLQDPVTARNDLLTFAKQGRVQDIEGFGEKSEQDLIEILEQQHKKSRIPYEQAKPIAEALVQELKHLPQVAEAVFLGSLRREQPTVGDIDLGICATHPKSVKQGIQRLSLVRDVLVAGENTFRVILHSGWQVDLKLAPQEEWGSFIQHFTGSKEHNIRLRELALRRGLSLSEHGILEKSTGKIQRFASEKAFYAALGFQLIPPAERVGGTEFEKYRAS